MQAMSEKVLYASKVEALVQERPDIFEVLWPEDLLDYTIMVIPRSVKKFSDYSHIRRYISNRYLVFINSKGMGHVKLTIVSVNTRDNIVYMPIDSFDSTWRYLKASINKSIQQQKEQSIDCHISRPEDLVDLSGLYRQGSTVSIKNDRVVYSMMELSQQEQKMLSARDELLSNNENLYFYAVQGNRYHDRDCFAVKFIDAKDLRASSQKPENLCACDKCQRRLLMRKATSINPNQVRAIDNHFFTPNALTDKQLEKLVEEYGFLFEMLDQRTLKVFAKEDSWVIRKYGDVYTLFHNNYKLVESGRSLTDGYHDQNVRSESLMVIFEYIHEYSYEKHIEAVKCKRKNKALVNRWGFVGMAVVKVKRRLRRAQRNRTSKYNYYKNNFVTQQQYNKTIDKMIKAVKTMDSRDEILEYMESLRR